MTQTVLSDSRFAMWRAVIALVHVDGVVSPYEIHFVREHLRGLTLTPAQTQILADDLVRPQNIETMFAQITAEIDKRDFFSLARVLCWSDGDFQQQEKSILSRLDQAYQNADSTRLWRESEKSVKEIMIGFKDVVEGEPKEKWLDRFFKSIGRQ
jgi:uncharacterized membrane protein YebE (DUF533 family)